eukprot:12913402-Prorocentrum_lima.AAC.1
MKQVAAVPQGLDANVDLAHCCSHICHCRGEAPCQCILAVTCCTPTGNMPVLQLQESQAPLFFLTSSQHL